MRLPTFAVLLFPFFTLTYASAIYERAGIRHTKRSFNPNRHVDSFASNSKHHIARDAPGNPGNKPCYRLTDKWCGRSFFDGWNFFTRKDPTHGLVNYVDSPTAFTDGLAYVDENDLVVMKVDSSRDLPMGTNRNSVRITSNKKYNGGLFVLDAQKFPHGCAVWPAFWMVGPSWPNNGEIDIFEGVNLDTANQYTAHTAAGCNISTTPSPDYSVRPNSATLGATYCGPSKKNIGCYYVDNRGGSYGAGLNDGGGAVLVMQWEIEGIRIWNFPRGYVPRDLESGDPQPETWSNDFLKGAWESANCPSSTYFRDMSMVFDITLCGDWAGNDYATSGCPGNCASRVMAGGNFLDAAWAISYVAVYNRDSDCQ